MDQWDRTLIKQRDRALQLHDTATRLKQGATQVNTELEAILLHQEEMHLALSELEKKVEAEDRKYDQPSDRQEAYALVEKLDTELSETKELLNDTVDRLNAKREAESAEQASMVRTVSNHVASSGEHGAGIVGIS